MGAATGCRLSSRRPSSRRPSSRHPSFLRLCRPSSRYPPSCRSRRRFEAPSETPDPSSGARQRCSSRWRTSRSCRIARTRGSNVRIRGEEQILAFRVEGRLVVVEIARRDLVLVAGLGIHDEDGAVLEWNRCARTPGSANPVTRRCGSRRVRPAKSSTATDPPAWSASCRDR